MIVDCGNICMAVVTVKSTFVLLTRPECRYKLCGMMIAPTAATPWQCLCSIVAARMCSPFSQKGGAIDLYLHQSIAIAQPGDNSSTSYCSLEYEYLGFLHISCLLDHK